jgi:hypothetical protein
MQLSDSEHAGPRMAPRLWSCPCCGYVELVDETHRAAYHEHVAPSVEQPAQSSVLPAVPEADSEIYVGASDAAIEAPADLAPLEEPAAVEDEPVVFAAPPDAPDALEPDAPADLAPLEEPPAAEPDAVVTVGISDAASAAPADGMASEVLAAPEAQAATSADVPDAAIDTATAPLQEHAELPNAAIPDTPAQDLSADQASDQASTSPDTPALPDSSAPVCAAGTAPPAHLPNSPNGIASTPKAGRRSRSQPPAAEPGAKQPAKRRSSGSKRKQTT